MPRLFKCPHCGHKLRYGAARCGWCWTPAPIRNRAGAGAFVIGIMAIGAVLIGFLLSP